MCHRQPDWTDGGTDGRTKRPGRQFADQHRMEPSPTSVARHGGSQSRRYGRDDWDGSIRTTVARACDRSGRLDTQSPHTFRAIHSNRNGLISHHLSQPNTVRGNRGERVECFDWTNHNLRGECTRSIERGTHGRCASVRWMRLDHSPQRHLLSLPQLRQQHGMQLTRKNHSFR